MASGKMRGLVQVAVVREVHHDAELLPLRHEDLTEGGRARVQMEASNHSQTASRGALRQ